MNRRMNENEEVESCCITYKKKWLSVTIQCIAFISIFEECFPSFGGVQKKKTNRKLPSKIEVKLLLYFIT